MLRPLPLLLHVLLPSPLLSRAAIHHLRPPPAVHACRRWPLHGSDELFDQCLQCWPHLTSLDLSGCSLEDLPPCLHDGGDTGGGPHLLRLLAHGNQLEAQDAAGEGPALPALPRCATLTWQSCGVCRPAARAAPRPALRGCSAHAPLAPACPPSCPCCSSMRQLSVDLHTVLQDYVVHASLRLPPGCQQLALVGCVHGESLDSAAALMRRLPLLLPELRHLWLHPELLDALDALPEGGTAATAEATLTRVAGRWRPTRLPGQPKRRADPLQPLWCAGVQIVALPDDDLCQLPALMGRPAAPDE